MWCKVGRANHNSIEINIKMMIFTSHSMNYNICRGKGWKVLIPTNSDRERRLEVVTVEWGYPVAEKSCTDIIGLHPGWMPDRGKRYFLHTVSYYVCLNVCHPPYSVLAILKWKLWLISNAKHNVDNSARVTF